MDFTRSPCWRSFAKASFAELASMRPRFPALSSYSKLNIGYDVERSLAQLEPQIGDLFSFR